MTGSVERFQVYVAYEKPPALRQPDICQISLFRQRSHPTQILTTDDGRTGIDHPDRFRVGHKSLTVGNVTGQIETAGAHKHAAHLAEHVKYGPVAPPAVRNHAGCGVHFLLVLA